MEALVLGGGKASSAGAAALAAPTLSAGSLTCRDSVRTSSGMRAASRNDAGISGHGSVADTSLCMVSNSPTLSSRQ